MILINLTIVFCSNYHFLHYKMYLNKQELQVHAIMSQDMKTRTKYGNKPLCKSKDALSSNCNNSRKIYLLSYNYISNDPPPHINKFKMK